MNKCLAAMELLVLLVLLRSVDEAASGGKAFRLAVSTSDGGVLCAVNGATQTIPVSDLRTPEENMPPQAACARHCTSQAPCHSFNYRFDVSSCEFYDHAPTECQSVPNCEYFQVYRKKVKLHVTRISRTLLSSAARVCKGSSENAGHENEEPNIHARKHRTRNCRPDLTIAHGVK